MGQVNGGTAIGLGLTVLGAGIGIGLAALLLIGARPQAILTTTAPAPTSSSAPPSASAGSTPNPDAGTPTPSAAGRSTDPSTTRVGLPALTVSSGLTRSAADHAATMAGAGSLQHQLAGESALGASSSVSSLARR